MMNVGIIILMAACHTVIVAEHGRRAGMVLETQGSSHLQAPSRRETAAAEPGDQVCVGVCALVQLCVCVCARGVCVCARAQYLTLSLHSAHNNLNPSYPF